MNTLNSISSRPFHDDQDFWRIRRLSICTFPTTGLGWNWDSRRWEGSRFYEIDPQQMPERLRNMRLWETHSGQLAGAVVSDSPGWYYLQLDPDYRAIEEEMIAWAEERFAAPLEDGSGRSIETEVWEYDAPRQRILGARGYEKMEYGGAVRRMYLGQRELPPVDMAEGYTMREIDAGNPQDCQRLANLLNAAFRRTFHNGPEFASFARCAPGIRPDLHLVAAAPDGSFAAHAALIYEEENRRGLYEPVCTHPDHRRKNLAQTLMLELLHRLKALGGAQATVETGDMIPANALYDAFGFTEVYRSKVWRKILPA